MRHFFILVFAIICSNLQASEKLDIITNIPSKLVPGQSYNIDVVINKGDLTSYAYFEQKLPAGIVAEAAENDNADFIFDAGKVRFVWLRLPQKNTIRLTYKIIVPADTVGFYEIEGRFSYIIKNQRGEIGLSPTRVSIGTDVQLAQLEKTTPSIVNPSTQDFIHKILTVKREKPDYMDFDKSYSVILLIRKDTANLPLRIEETLPKGFTPQALKTSGAKFTSTKNKVIFEWTQLPDKPYFTISYLAKGTKHTPKLTLDVEGKFTFEKNGKKYSFYTDKNYGANFHKPSLDDLRRRNAVLKDSLSTPALPVDSTKIIQKQPVNTNTKILENKVPEKKSNSIDEMKEFLK